MGINLSGGLDSSTLLATVRDVQGAESAVQAFTFTTGDPSYDELPWVRTMVERTRHPLVECLLTPGEVPALAESVQAFEDEPFGGLPTLAYARLFERARERGVVVLIDGQGMDEQWAGYDYYRQPAGGVDPTIQGTSRIATRPACLVPEFRTLGAEPDVPRPFPDRLRNLQYRDIRFTKLPRALRFNDRASMRVSAELREPFLDHRLVELALRQPPERKIHDGTGKWLLRQIAKHRLPRALVDAPKRPVQTPQREWLRGPLRAWARDRVEQAIADFGGSWLDADATRQAFSSYCDEAEESSFHVWQWISLGMIARASATAALS